MNDLAKNLLLWVVVAVVVMLVFQSFSPNTAGYDARTSDQCVQSVPRDHLDSDNIGADPPTEAGARQEGQFGRDAEREFQTALAADRFDWLQLVLPHQPPQPADQRERLVDDQHARAQPRIDPIRHAMVQTPRG